MNIGIDVDGVLTDIGGYQLKYGSRYFKKHGLRIVDPEGFDIETIFACSHKESSGFWHRYIWKYCLSEPVIPGAAAVLRRLHSEGHRIIIITSRVYTAEKSAMGMLFRTMLLYWLRRNKICYDEIVYCADDSDGSAKFKACIEKNIGIMIDDKPENLSAIADRLQVICYPAAWNRKIIDKRFIRVSGWKEVYKMVRKICG